jgi:membrane associated rhomboid family serine protease
MARRLRRSAAPVTTALLALNALIWFGQISPWGYLFTGSMAFTPGQASVEPWRMITAGFVHDWSGPLHILLNSYAIYIFGRQLEPMLGGFRYLVLYIVSIFGGSVAVLWLSPVNTWVVGASGAFFGLMGAYFVVIRSLGGNAAQLLVLIAINLSLGFFVPGISWEGHLGGLVTGAAVAAIYTDTRRPNQRVAQLIGVAVLVILLIALSWWRVQQIYS